MGGSRFFFLAVLLAAGSACSSSDFNAAEALETGVDIDASGDESAVVDATPTVDSSFEDGFVAPSDAEVDAFREDFGSLPDGPISCTGKPNGTLCDSSDGKRRICIDGGCILSKCGDRYVDKAIGEECDDGNEAPKDGCEPITCKFSCKLPSECDDKNPCTLGETCSAAHACTAGTPAPAGTLCKLPSGTDGVCNGGSCASASCGNKATEPGEDCDDGNLINDDGCRNDCKFTCVGDADCDDKDPCNGAETCVSHVCKKGTAPTCDDGNPCTANLCTPFKGCNNPFIDADGDGYAPAPKGSCGGAFAGKDGDCNDGNNAINPSRPEICNGIDDNCNGATDEGLPLPTCGVGACKRTGTTCNPASCVPAMGTAEICNNIDDDCNGSIDEGVTKACYDGPVGTSGKGICKDGVATCSAGSFGTCVGQVTPAPEVCNGKDDNCNGVVDDIPATACYTGPGGTSGVGICKSGTKKCSGSSEVCDGQVLPDSTFHTTASAGSFDYNCDGTAEHRWPTRGNCGTVAAGCPVTEGWQGLVVPACGVEANWIDGCELFEGGGDPPALPPRCIVVSAPLRIQECR